MGVVLAEINPGEQVDPIAEPAAKPSPAHAPHSGPGCQQQARRTMAFCERAVFVSNPRLPARRCPAAKSCAAIYWPMPPPPIWRRRDFDGNRCRVKCPPGYTRATSAKKSAKVGVLVRGFDIDHRIEGFVGERGRFCASPCTDRAGRAAGAARQRSAGRIQVQPCVGGRPRLRAM